ncbi:MAG: HAD-IA family hydrolase [Gammaproteobacteria bacterium]|nr:HAD-IA family hydrolase [Gammaproteobacteria bacterium]
MILKDIECMLVDMDGVILDNTYDNNFWQNQIPGVISKNKNISFEDAKRLAVQIFNYKKNTKDWYDVDYWSNMLNVDIEAEKRSSISFDRIQLYEGVTKTLNKLKDNFRLILITNAHRKTLNIKLEKYDLSPYFENMICAHELHYVKENIQLWYMLKSRFKLDYTKTLLIEDTINNIKVGLSAGISQAVYLGDEIYEDSKKILKLSSINDIFPAFNQ